MCVSFLVWVVSLFVILCTMYACMCVSMFWCVCVRLPVGVHTLTWDISLFSSYNSIESDCSVCSVRVVVTIHVRIKRHTHTSSNCRCMWTRMCQMCVIVRACVRFNFTHTPIQLNWMCVSVYEYVLRRMNVTRELNKGSDVFWKEEKTRRLERKRKYIRWFFRMHRCV